MASDTDTASALERRLREDLKDLGDRLADERFATELYRALGNRAWRSADGPEGHVALSWKRAEELVNELRAGHEPLTLAQTGGEGEVSSAVEQELGRRGWTSSPLNTGREDPAHAGKDHDSPPPRDTGQRLAPEANTRDWEREAHTEASEQRRP